MKFSVVYELVNIMCDISHATCAAKLSCNSATVLLHDRHDTLMVSRCEWAKTEPAISYHDCEWGMPEHNDSRLFEFLVLEGAQAGLSWITILKRRNGYRKAFSNFDVRKVSKYHPSKIQKLQGDKSIIRNRLKILSAINNAQHFEKIQDEFGTFDRYIWGFVRHKPVRNKYVRSSDIPAYTPVSEQMSRDLKRRGFTFVGPTICYAFMQATGMVNDHVIGCFRYGK